MDEHVRELARKAKKDPYAVCGDFRMGSHTAQVIQDLASAVLEVYEERRVAPLASLQVVSPDVVDIARRKLSDGS